MRHSTSYHLIRSGDDKVGFTAYCGHKQHSTYNLTRIPNHYLCPKCSSRYYSEQVKESPYQLGERLDLSQDKRRYTYKSIYEILDGTRPITKDTRNAVIGFVTIDNGWGKSWEVRPWISGSTPIEGKDIPPPVMAPDRIVFECASRVSGSSMHKSSFASKEEALFFVPLMVEQGKLPTHESIFAQTKAHLESWRQRLAANKARQQEANDKRAEQNALIGEEFGAMLKGKLSNRQVEALNTAAELLGIKL